MRAFTHAGLQRPAAASRNHGGGMTAVLASWHTPAKPRLLVLLRNQQHQWGMEVARRSSCWGTASCSPSPTTHRRCCWGRWGAGREGCLREWAGPLHSLFPKPICPCLSRATSARQWEALRHVGCNPAGSGADQLGITAPAFNHLSESPCCHISLESSPWKRQSCSLFVLVTPVCKSKGSGVGTGCPVLAKL